MGSHIRIKEFQWRLVRSVLVTFVASAMFVGCATTTETTEAEQRASLDALLKQADSELVNGKNDRSIALLNQAAKENPTSMMPWLKMSNIWFNANNYPSAILTANEVLKRESGNQEAKSILVVAGLRVAAGAIAGLVPQNPVNSTARVEAENLTKALRNALGEKVLVPGPDAAAAPPSAQPVKHHYKHVARSTRADAPTASSGAATAPAAPPSTISSSGSDPFKSLK